MPHSQPVHLAGEPFAELKALQAAFGNDAAEVYEEADGRNHATLMRAPFAFGCLATRSPDATTPFLVLQT